MIKDEEPAFKSLAAVAPKSMNKKPTGYSNMARKHRKSSNMVGPSQGEFVQASMKFVVKNLKEDNGCEVGQEI